MTIKLLFVFGTRPEAIKLAPVIDRAREEKGAHCKVCVTAQHREMLDQVLRLFAIIPDYDLDLMSKGQDLFYTVTNALNGLKRVLRRENPDMVLVQGDTSTTMSAALAAFFLKIKIGHVEAGLRTWNKYAPFPEEMNRVVTSRLADFHFCPTEKSKRNLLLEGIDEKRIFVTGNTVIDSLFRAVDEIKKDKKAYERKFSFLRRDRKQILVTGHRRENFGQGLLNICMALRTISMQFKGSVDIVYPVHLNPNVQKPVRDIIGNIGNIYLLNPLEYLEFVYLMQESYIILTDSGGIQEEAPSIGKPVLVMREITERPEAAEIGTVKIVGTEKNRLVQETTKLLTDKAVYAQMSKRTNTFGDGKAADRIVDFISRNLNGILRH
jgi:UDP-N-acetylglucosamine 2-epimerase (non-hydrolysing)